MKKLLLLSISLFLITLTSLCYSQPQIKVTEVGSVRFYKPYETIYKNLYAMRMNPYRINDTVIFSKLLFGNIEFEANYQFKDNKLTQILLSKNSINKDEFIHITEVMKTNYGRQTKKELTSSGFEIYWSLNNVDIVLNLNNTEDRYDMFFTIKN